MKLPSPRLLAAPLIAALVLGCASFLSAAEPVAQRYTFDGAEDAAAFAATVTGEAERRKGGPNLAEGKLDLLSSWWQSDASVAFPAPSPDRTRIVEARWQLTMNTGTEGAGFVWLDTDEHGESGPAPALEKWEEPSLARAFGVGFDASNPPNRDPFRGSGNAYDRPQHEVSLHWDGMEVFKKTTPEDFRDGEPHAIGLRIQFVVGGALIRLTIDDAAMYEDFFIPAMTAYRGRPGLGARNGEQAGEVSIDDLVLTCHEPLAAPPAPLGVVAIERALNDKEHPKNSAEVEFPADTSRYGRIILTLRLDQPETRFDPWDRLAAINVLDEHGESFEILRYITPYHRGHEWQVDVTAFRPLLEGKRRIEQVCSTQGEGWVVTVRFDFYPGPVDRLAQCVVRLWSGQCEVGNPDQPPADFYQPRTEIVADEVEFAEVRTVVTGHGMSPNTNNAAEFMPIERTLTVNGASFTNRLWKTDNYLNPCRPQGGTWKYDRAGWAPGDVVRPWVVDVTHLVDDDRRLQISYQLADYVNEARGQTWAPFHKAEAYLVLYRSAAEGSLAHSSAPAVATGESSAAEVVQRACELLVANQENYSPDRPVGSLPAAELGPWQQRERDRLQAVRKKSGASACEWPYEGVYRVGPDGRIPPGYRVGGSAIVCQALLEAPGFDARRRAAVLRSVEFMLDMIDGDPGMKPRQQTNYDVRGWGHAYALEFFLRGLDRKLFTDELLRERVNKTIPHLIACLKEGQVNGGGWNYAGRGVSPFMTASTLIALFHARAAGFSVDSTMVEAGLDALAKGRGESVAYSYSGASRPDEPMAGACARSAAAELCLFRAGRSDAERLRRAIDGFFTEDHWQELLKRKSQQGTHVGPYGIAPYYFYYGHTYAALAVEHLPADQRPAYRQKMHELLWRTLEGAGWNDRIFPRTESYSTAMAVLSLIAQDLPPVAEWKSSPGRREWF